MTAGIQIYIGARLSVFKHIAADYRLKLIVNAYLFEIFFRTLYVCCGGYGCPVTVLVEIIKKLVKTCFFLYSVYIGIFFHQLYTQVVDSNIVAVFAEPLFQLRYGKLS